MKAIFVKRAVSAFLAGLMTATLLPLNVVAGEETESANNTEYATEPTLTHSELIDISEEIPTKSEVPAKTDISQVTTLSPDMTKTDEFLTEDVAERYNTSSNGSCGDNVTYSFDSITGTLTISGSGSMADFDDNLAPWYNYCTDIHSIIVQQGVTSIGDWAFYNCVKLNSVVLPDSLQIIGDEAFYKTGITEISIPSNVKAIGGWAFGDCLNLSTVTFPDTLQVIDGAALYGTGITEIELPSGVTTIGDWTFGNCVDLSKVTLPDTLQTIGEYAFYNTGITEIEIPSEVTTIGDWAFRNCMELSMITLPEGIQYIGFAAFENCVNLKSIEIPASLAELEQNVFYECTGLEEVKLNEGLRYIKWRAFYGCESLTEIIFPSTLKDYPNLTVFENCSSLRKLTFTGIPTSWTHEPVYEFQGVDENFEIWYVLKTVYFNYEYSIPDMIKACNPTIILAKGVIFNYFILEDKNTTLLVQIQLSEPDGNEYVIITDESGNQRTEQLNATTLYSSIEIPYSAKNYGDEFTIELFDSNGELLDTAVVSVSRYAEDSFNNIKYNSYSDGFATVWENILKAMLNYGAAAQEYFSYKENHLVNSKVNDFASLDDEKTVLSTASKYELNDISYDGVALMLKSTLGTKHYFTINGSLEDYTVSIDGTEYSLQQYDENIYYVECYDYVTSRYDEEHVLTITDGTNSDIIVYSINSLLYDVVNGQFSDSFKKLASALYTYGYYAKEYYDYSMSIGY